MRRLAFALGTLALFACSADVDDVFRGDGGGGVGGDGAGGPSSSSTASMSSPTSSSVSTSSSMSTTSTTSNTGTTTNTTVNTSTGGQVCGNGVAEPPEQCDAQDLGGASCVDLGYVNPTGATCTPNCTVDYGFCEPECGNMVLEPDEACDDGNTIDGDGCSSQCQAEPTGCLAPIPTPVALGTTIISGSTTGGANNFQPAMANGCSNGSGPDVVYEITPMSAGFLTAWLPAATASFDSMMYFRTACGDQASQLQCNDNFGTPGNDGGELLSIGVEAGVPVYLVVDGFGGESGTFDLSLDLSTGEDCSDPVPITIEGNASIRARGATTGHTHDIACAALFGQGPDVVYEITVDATGTYDFDLTAVNFNSVLQARSSCSAAIPIEFGCDSPNNSEDSDLTINFQNNLTFSLWVDGTSMEEGDYFLFIDQP